MSTDYFFSVRAAERITNQKVKRVSLWRNGTVLIYFKNGNINVADPLEFQQDFVDFRQQRSREILLSRLTKTLYACKSAAHDQVYSVVLEADGLRCNCKDWEIQSEQGIEHPCCKHGYAVLRSLGCDSLQDYLKMPF